MTTTRSRIVRCLLILFVIGFAATAVMPETAFAQRRRRKPQADENEVPSPKLYKSRNFHVITDLPKEDSEDLLGRLETMLKLVSAYWGRRNTRPIEMYVIDDFDNWPETQLAKMDPDGVAMVRGGGGLTITQVISRGNEFVSKAVVYAGSDHGTPQHEAVHAFCGHAFGTTGPVWYSEGMAEVGQYWRENDKSVTTPEVVIEYLKSSELKELDDIVNNPLETTGDSWQNYAWRWALCHLLGFNENYTKRFKPLGLALLAKQDVDFWQVYGSQAEEISFEYKLFVEDLAPGYRCDLCSWDWKTRFKGLQGSALVQSAIRADRGWQASRLKVFEGTTYAVETSGTWKLAKDGEALPPAGAESGEGRLVGVIFSDYELSEPFDLPTESTWTAPSDGDLFLRCYDDWGAIADNKGTVKVKLKLADDDAAAGE